jgi:hypothetical protein
MVATVPLKHIAICTLSLPETLFGTAVSSGGKRISQVRGPRSFSGAMRNRKSLSGSPAPINAKLFQKTALVSSNDLRRSAILLRKMNSEAQLADADVDAGMMNYRNMGTVFNLQNDTDAASRRSSVYSISSMASNAKHAPAAPATLVPKSNANIAPPSKPMEKNSEQAVSSMLSPTQSQVTSMDHKLSSTNARILHPTNTIRAGTGYNMATSPSAVSISATSIWEDASIHEDSPASGMDVSVPTMPSLFIEKNQTDSSASASIILRAAIPKSNPNNTDTAGQAEQTLTQKQVQAQVKTQNAPSASPTTPHITTTPSPDLEAYENFPPDTTDHDRDRYASPLAKKHHLTYVTSLTNKPSAQRTNNTANTTVTAGGGSNNTNNISTTLTSLASNNQHQKRKDSFSPPPSNTFGGGGGGGSSNKKRKSTSTTTTSTSTAKSFNNKGLGLELGFAFASAALSPSVRQNQSRNQNQSPGVTMSVAGTLGSLYDAEGFYRGR